jgi:catalase
MADNRVTQEFDPKAGSTTAAGAPAPSDRNSLSIGPDGPDVLIAVTLIYGVRAPRAV